MSVACRVVGSLKSRISPLAWRVALVSFFQDRPDHVQVEVVPYPRQPATASQGAGATIAAPAFELAPSTGQAIAALGALLAGRTAIEQPVTGDGQ